ncbi:MAG: glutathione synthase/RimK-type ligase-like ATP-grasp enzyme [Kiritimatiellia bacterium]|jgi:glutathione synthase/RimK-type ligase-like ATP-grasp enzyme
MNIIFLVESLDNKTASNLIDAIHKTGHSVDVVPYHSQGENQGSMVERDGVRLLFCNGKYYAPDQYDAALLWCWGTATIGRQYLRLFEDQGVFVINSTYTTEITDSKIDLTRAFKENNLSIPNTLFFDNGIPQDTFPDSLKNIESTLGSPPYVFKADYSSQGIGIQFAESVEEVREFAWDLYNKNPKRHGFILQEFIGNHDLPIFHYRVLVLGDIVFPHVLKVTATQPMKVSNVATGGIVELSPMHSTLERASLRAAEISGLTIAGVDLMVKLNHLQEPELVVLEINDGPGTKTFDRKGCDASSATINLFIQTMENALSTVRQKAIATINL